MDQPIQPRSLKTVSLLILLSILQPVSKPAFSADTFEYEVELLIFENLRNNETGELAGNINIEDSKQNPILTDAVWLDRSSFRITHAKAALKKSSAYRPLLHVAWRQTIDKKSGARSVKLTASNTAQNGGQLTGLANVSRGRYLHLELDLTLGTGSLKYEGDSVNGYNSIYSNTAIKLKESRRMRSNELHYFDHPNLGVLALITPVEE